MLLFEKKMTKCVQIGRKGALPSAGRGFLIGSPGSGTCLSDDIFQLFFHVVYNAVNFF